MVAGETLRRFLDLENRGTGRERRPRGVPDLLEKRTADHQHEIATAERLGDAFGIDREPAPEVGVVVRHCLVLMNEFDPDRGAGRLGERDHGIAGAGPRGVVADDERRRRGGEDMTDHRADAFGIGRRRTIERAGARGGDPGLLLHDVDWQADEHRT